jgi:hypothetical protein
MFVNCQSRSNRRTTMNHRVARHRRFERMIRTRVVVCDASHVDLSVVSFDGHDVTLDNAYPRRRQTINGKTYDRAYSCFLFSNKFSVINAARWHVNNCSSNDRHALKSIMSTGCWQSRTTHVVLFDRYRFVLTKLNVAVPCRIRPWSVIAKERTS